MTTANRVLWRVKLLKIVAGLLLVLILLHGYGYINLLVSEKYETDGTIISLSDKSPLEKQQELEKLEIRSLEIQDQKKKMVVRGLLFLTAFVAISGYLMDKKRIALLFEI